VSKFYVYIVECSDGSLYTGIARDVAKRVKEHNEAKTGARYTKSRRPVRLRYSEGKRDRSAALVREAALKKLSREEKLALIGTK
jgi:putative endonuclease